MRLKNEDKFKIILTTQYVLVDGSPITYVLYDEDGDWQLFGAETIPEDESPYTLMVEEIMQIEPALRSLPDMQKGQAVVREPGSTTWCFVGEDLASE